MKSLLREIYYRLYNNSVVSVKGEHAARGKKWIVNRRFSRAYFSGYYETALSQFMGTSLEPGAVFVDAGSHAGYFSLIAASKVGHGHVYSFEPDPENYDFIKRIRDVNGLLNWTVENLALSSRRALLGFSTHIYSSMGKVDNTGQLAVSAVSLDEYFLSKGIERFDLFKIDVEGHGGQLLEGARNTIDRFKPVIVVEIHRGSDELETAFNLFADQYEFINFDTRKVLERGNSTAPDFLLMLPFGRSLQKPFYN